MLVAFDHTPAFEAGPFLMLSERSSVDIHALKRQGMTISEIARRTHHDRKTIRACLKGERTPGQRERGAQESTVLSRSIRNCVTRTPSSCCSACSTTTQRQPSGSRWNLVRTKPMHHAQGLDRLLASAGG